MLVDWISVFVIWLFTIFLDSNNSVNWQNTSFISHLLSFKLPFKASQSMHCCCCGIKDLVPKTAQRDGTYWSLLYVHHWFKHIMSIRSFNPLESLWSRYNCYPLWNRWENWTTEKLRNSSCITGIMSTSHLVSEFKCSPWNQKAVSSLYWEEIGTLSFNYFQVVCFEGLPGWLSGEESTCQYRRHGYDLWVRKIPWRRKWHHSSILVWKISWTEEPGRLQFIGSQRVGHYWTCMCMFWNQEKY